MAQDRSPLDDLPDDGAPDAQSARRQRQIVLALLSVLLVVGAVGVLVLLAGQREPTSGGTTTDVQDPATSTPTGDTGGAPTAETEVDEALADLDSARSTLEAAVSSADDLLRATEGEVADDTSRAGLVDALTVARSVLDADVDRTRLGDVQTATAGTRASTANVQHAAGIVADSHDEWLLQQGAPPSSVPDAPAPGPTEGPVPIPVPTGSGEVPGPVTPPDRTPQPGPAPIPIPDDQR